MQGDGRRLKKPEAKLNFVLQIFEGEHRRVEPLAAQQLVAVLGERTGEMAAMCPNCASISMTTPSPWISSTGT